MRQMLASLAGGDLLEQVEAVAAEVDLDGVPLGGVVLPQVGLLVRAMIRSSPAPGSA